MLEILAAQGYYPPLFAPDEGVWHHHPQGKEYGIEPTFGYLRRKTREKDPFFGCPVWELFLPDLGSLPSYLENRLTLAGYQHEPVLYCYDPRLGPSRMSYLSFRRGSPLPACRGEARDCLRAYQQYGIYNRKFWVGYPAGMAFVWEEIN